MIRCSNTLGNKLRQQQKKKNSEISKTYKCAGCGKKFVYALGFKCRYYDADTITDALFYVVTGLSPEDVANELKRKNFDRISPQYTGG